MTTVRVVASHQVVSAVYPRKVTERDEVAMATGRAIDSALSKFSHEYARNLRPTAADINAYAASVLDEGVRDADVELAAADRDRILGEIAHVVRAFRKSEIFGLSRPRSRLIVINEQVGCYAQPDFWDGRSRFYEMKSYLANPPPNDVMLQLRLFQLAFPGFRGVLISFNRHVVPVRVGTFEARPLSEADTLATLRLIWKTAQEMGQEKVLAEIEGEKIGYAVPSAASSESQIP